MLRAIDTSLTFRHHRKICRRNIFSPPPYTPTPSSVIHNRLQSRHLLAPALQRQRALHPIPLPALHNLQTLGEVLPQTQLALQKRARLLQPLNIPADLPILALSGLFPTVMATATSSRIITILQPHLDDIHHALIQPGVKVRARRRIGIIIPPVVAPVRIEVPAQLDQQLEGQGGTARQGSQILDAGDQLRQRGRERGRGQVCAQRVLQAVQIVVQHRHLAVELVVERCGGRGVVVHGCADARGHVGAQAALVDPGVHVCALVFECLQSVGRLFELGPQVFDLFLVGPDGFVEDFDEGVWGGLQAAAAGGGVRVPAGHCHAGCLLVGGVGTGGRGGCVGGVVVLGGVTSGVGPVGLLELVGGVEAGGVLGVFVGLRGGVLRVLGVRA